MVKKIIILILFFYFLALFQTSFLVHFNLWFIFQNLILISVILFSLFEDKKEPFGIYGAFLGGFFWDIFSQNPIGLNALILTGISIFIKKIFKKHVRISFFKRI